MTTLTRTTLHVTHLPVTAQRLADELSGALGHRVRWEWEQTEPGAPATPVFITGADPDAVRDAACLWLPDGGWWVGS